ncbi:MAG: 1-deoxy-D-xylulose-5-phosphate synthase [Candidatus Omnitrophica bacterium]|nr:1-deoxy-D-xylulose-5-phosphate synthase [Candidatus Omnitrophota bacterium]
MLLESLHAPRDMRKLPPEQLSALAGEIRKRIIEVVSKTGGHLASSLGAVEIAIALHYCLDTPHDKIVWDVGHQCYAHKILTGRNKHFTCLRQYEGLTGFPCKDESEYDSFTTGHSSTAVSLALGLASARDMLPKEKSFKVAAVIGDGSLSGGLCFEGLNNAGHLKKDLLIVLNTNEMSIAPNVGAISTYLNKLISMPVYNRFKNALDNFVASRIPKGSRLIKIANKFEEGLKGLFIPGMLFEELGFRYFGPFDGNDLTVLIPTLKNILSIKGPRLLHVVTKKGKGYAPAEKDAVRFHSAAPFVIETGQPAKKDSEQSPTFTQVLGKSLVELGREHTNVCAITAAMPEGTGLDLFRDSFPDRFFDVGIAESHAVCFAAGLAKQGLKPVVAIYSTFLQRAYDQIIEDIALQGVGAVFVLDRAGIVGDDGATHQGVFDIAFLRHIPNVTLMAPKDGDELRAMLAWAADAAGPVFIRYPKDRTPANRFPLMKQSIKEGEAELLCEGRDVTIVAYGSMVAPAFASVELLKKAGLSIGVVNARFAKPLDISLLRQCLQKSKHIVTVEDGILEGGFGSAVMEALKTPVIRIGVPSEFIPCGKREFLLQKYGLTAEGIAGTIQSIIR